MLRSIRSLDDGGGRDGAGGRGSRLHVECIGDTSPALDNHAHGSLLWSIEFLAVVGHLLLVRIHGKLILTLAPGHSEGVRGPESKLRDVDVGVLAWLEFPWAGHGDGNAHGIAGECFVSGRRNLASEVSVENAEEAKGTLKGPEDNGNIEVILPGRVALEVHREENEGENGNENVKRKEGLVEGMAEDGWRMHEEKYKGAGGLRILEKLHEVLSVTLTMKPV